MVKVTFDGVNKIITVATGVTYLDAGTEIYLEWKNWVLQSDNSKYLAAFRSFGGDPTTENQNAPCYYFLTNGWKVKVENLIVTISENLYSDDYPTPYWNINSTILSKNSDIPSIFKISEQLSGITDTLIDIDNNMIDIAFDVKHILGLVQSNFRLSNHVYDPSGRLLSCTIKIFNNKTDCNNNVNEFASYSMNSSYDSKGLLIDYKVIKN